MEIQEIKEQLKSIFRQVINNDKWITIHPNGEDGKGRPLLLKDGESPKEAIERTYKKEDKSDKKDGGEKTKKENYQEIIDRLDKKYGTDKNDKGESWYDRASVAEIRTDIKTLEHEIDKNEKEIKRLKDLPDDIASKIDGGRDNKIKGLQEQIARDKEHIEYANAHIEKKTNTNKQSDSKGEKVADTKILQGGVKESHDEYGRTIFSKKDSNKKVKIHKNGNFYLASYGEELKNDDGYTEFQVFPSASGKSFKTEEGARKWALKQLKADNSKEQDMALLEDLKKLITKVENDKGEEDMEIKNEKVDKRKLIDEVAGIMKSAGCDDEVIRTAIGKMEKMSYDDSEKSADNECEDKEDVKNCGKKVKNEDEEDKKEVEEIEEDVKEDVENRGKKNVKNSKTDYFAKLNEIYNSAANALEKCEYVSRADREKAAEDYFAR